MLHGGSIGRRVPLPDEEPAEFLDSFGEYAQVQRVTVCRATFDANMQDWFDEGDRCQLLGKTVFADGWERSVGTERPWSVGRTFLEQRLRSELEISVHAYSSHGAAVMALLRLAWLRHGWHVIEEWDDVVGSIPVVRQRAERMVPMHDSGMARHEFNPVILDKAEEVVFAYDPARDVMREWHTVWDDAPCQLFAFLSLRFTDAMGIGDRLLPWTAGAMSPFRPSWPFRDEPSEHR